MAPIKYIGADIRTKSTKYFNWQKRNSTQSEQHFRMKYSDDWRQIFHLFSLYLLYLLYSFIYQDKVKPSLCEKNAFDYKFLGWIVCSFDALLSSCEKFKMKVIVSNVAWLTLEHRWLWKSDKDSPQADILRAASLFLFHDDIDAGNALSSSKRWLICLLVLSLLLLIQTVIFKSLVKPATLQTLSICSR